MAYIQDVIPFLLRITNLCTNLKCTHYYLWLSGHRSKLVWQDGKKTFDQRGYQHPNGNFARLIGFYGQQKNVCIAQRYKRYCTHLACIGGLQDVSQKSPSKVSCNVFTNTLEGTCNKRNGFLVRWSYSINFGMNVNTVHGQNTIPIGKHDGASMLWAYFLCAGTGEPDKIEERMDGAKDGEILVKNLRKSSER